MSETSILHPADAEALFDQGLVDKCDTTGFQRVHKRRLNRSSDEEHSEVPLSTSL